MTVRPTQPSDDRRPATLAGLVAGAAERHAARDALVWEGKRWTYATLAAESARVALGLRELGVKPGDRVGVLLPNWPEFFAAVFGATALGAVAVGLNTLATESELAYYLDHAQVDTLIYTPHFLRHDYQAALDGFGVGKPAAERSNARDLRNLIAFAPDGRLPAGAQALEQIGSPVGDGAAALRALDSGDGDAPAMIFFTSGSTARPKALVHAHRALVHQAFVASQAFGLTEDDRAWGCLPMFFTGGFVIIALITLASGGAVVLQDHFEAGHALDLMERERISFYAGWQLAPALCDHPSFASRSLALRKGIFTNVPAAGKLLCEDNVTVGSYGLSETATIACMAHWDDPRELRHRGFGRPLPGVELRVVDPATGAACAPGETGEILVKGPSLMLGYLGVAREETFDAEGFFHTGDYGRLDETGTLRFDGRLKEVIKTAGVNVAAAEVEACLGEASGVAVAYVVPVPHPVRGENVAAFLVPRSGTQLDVADVLRQCRRELASYKVPRHLFVLAADDVPRTGTQKVDKPLLRRRAAELAGGEQDLIAKERDPGTT
jgi:fatty-acyl-CoA synthase